MSESSNKTRLAELDMLRGVAVVLVLFRHPVLHAQQAGWLAVPALWIETFGWLGVDMFFVLSGFLIGGLLFAEFRKHGSVDVLRFLIRRGLKIYPAYIACIAYGVIFYYRHEHVSFRQAVRAYNPNYLHIQNYIASPMHHTWTLALEEHFYLMLPLLVAVLVKFRRMNLMPVMALICLILCNLLRLGQIGKPFTNPTHAWPTHLRADSLFFGVLLSYFVQFHPAKLAPLTKRPGLLGLFGLLILLPAGWVPFDHPALWTLGFTMAYLGCGSILLAAISIEHHNPLTRKILTSFFARILCFIGFYSYSIYLWHTILAVARMAYWIHQGKFDRLPTTLRWIVVMGVYMVIAVLAGAFLATLIERPFLALRDRNYPRRLKEMPGSRGDAEVRS